LLLIKSQAKAVSQISKPAASLPSLSLHCHSHSTALPLHCALILQAHHFVSWQKQDVNDHDATTSTVRDASTPAFCFEPTATDVYTLLADHRLQSSGSGDCDLVLDCSTAAAGAAPENGSSGGGSSADATAGFALPVRGSSTGVGVTGQPATAAPPPAAQAKGPTGCQGSSGMVALSEAQTWLILEFCDQGNLADAVRNGLLHHDNASASSSSSGGGSGGPGDGSGSGGDSSGSINLSHALQLLLDVAMGMAYLHARWVMGVGAHEN